MRLLHILALAMLCPIASKANSISDADRQSFISTYVDIAVAEMHRTGIPASITLGQAILESSWGLSSIATDANNLFCIKCYNGWEGPSYSAKDDEPGLSCFRKYESILQSFIDHSDFLRNNERYRPLFQHQVTDYEKWANGLQACGYATDQQYAAKLTGIIEDYGLWVYDHAMNANQFAVLSSPDMPTAEEEPEVPAGPASPPPPERTIAAPEIMEKPDYRWETLPQQMHTTPPINSPVKLQKRKIRPIVPLSSLDLERR